MLKYFLKHAQRSPFCCHSARPGLFGQKLSQKRGSSSKLSVDVTKVSPILTEKQLFFGRRKGEGKVGGGRARSHFLSLPSRPLPLSFFLLPRSIFCAATPFKPTKPPLCRTCNIINNSACSMHNSHYRIDPDRRAKVMWQKFGLAQRVTLPFFFLCKRFAAF